jgi:predicted RND superfamily exporter protein
LFYRSLVVALIGLAPVALTLAINFAWMSETGVWLDVGTSMIAGITFGVGVDYSIHILSALKGTAAADWRARVLQSVGLVSRPVVFNTVAVAVGFLVLTLASYQPIQHMGRFAAATLAVSATIALVVIPLLAFCLQPRALAERRHSIRLDEEVTVS